MPVQSLCADILKIAMYNLYFCFKNTRIKLIMTVHDEVVYECPVEMQEETALAVKQEMERAGNLYLEQIPCRADVYVSDCWQKKQLWEPHEKGA